MSRPGRRLAVQLSVIAVAVAVCSVPDGWSRTNGSPFYLVPAPTKECRGVANCESAVGPWVAVPARGEATFLMGCPSRFGFVVGGTDARASSPQIRVWFEGELGPSTGFPPTSNPNGAVVLFHATSDDGRAGAFQAILGCVSLKNTTKVSTVSIRFAAAPPGTAPGPPLDLRANTVVVGQGAPTRTAVRCPPHERLVGSWSAYALDTTVPPDPRYLDAVTIRTTTTGSRVLAKFEVGGALLTPLAPIAWVQLGAMCEP